MQAKAFDIRGRVSARVVFVALSAFAVPFAAFAAFAQDAVQDAVQVSPGHSTDAVAKADHAPAVSPFIETGAATFYARSFQGRRTASGERYDMNELSAAHRTLPLGSYVRVTNLSTRRSVVVRVNDRGPFMRGRIVDLSFAAATMIGLQHSGTARVTLEPVSSRDAQVAPAVRPVRNAAAHTHGTVNHAHNAHNAHDTHKSKRVKKTKTVTRAKKPRKYRASH
jgi:rare lipoprotein A